MQKHFEISGPLHLNPSSDASRLTISFISHAELSNTVPGSTAVVMYSMADTAEQCADNLHKNVSPVATIEIAPARSENNHYIYSFSINRKGISLGIECHFYPECDLSKRPLGICFQISGGNEIGFGITSNILKIDRHAIAASLGTKTYMPPSMTN